MMLLGGVIIVGVVLAGALLFARTHRLDHEIRAELDEQGEP
jgi:hypothetical protein